MNKIYWLDQIQAEERFLVGEKAFALSWMQQNGYPILPGFAINASILRQFLKIIGKSESLLADFPHSALHLDPDNYHVLQTVAQKIRQKMIETPLPPEWEQEIFSAALKLNSPTLILRSSLTLPYPVMAGLLPAQVCLCEREALSMAVKLTWAELFRARNLFYCQKAKIPIEQPILALLVQPIAAARVSGTVALDDNHIYIQATWGLGHSIISGEVSPDYYQINRSTGKVEVQQLGNKPLAYGLKAEAKSTDFHQTCLETILLSEEQQTQYALDQDSANQLIKLTEKLADMGTIEWTFLADEEKTPQLYINQFYPHFSPTRKPLMKQKLFKGLAASPGVAIAPAQVLADSNLELVDSSGSILITKEITPHCLPLLKKAAGVIAEKGGITSHAAIIARELGIPAIVGAKDATTLIQNGESVLLNGDRGFFYPLPQGKEEYLAPKETPTSSFFPNYPFGTQLLVNLSQPSSINSAAQLPVDGVGLIRAELMLLDLLSSQPLEEWLFGAKKLTLLDHLIELMCQFTAAFAPRPVFYRSYDCQPQFSSQQILKARGTQNYLLDPTFFYLELEAIAAVFAAGFNNLNLILPFVRSVEEFTFCRQSVEQFGLNKFHSFQLWIMAEVPSVIFQLPEYVRAGVQGIAIGTNDLCELLLGVERNLPLPGFNARHPAILKAIKQLIELAKDAGIPCSICGQAPVDHPELIEQLIKWGITAISVEPLAVAKTYQAIARAEQRLLLEAARSQTT